MYFKKGEVDIYKENKKVLSSPVMTPKKIQKNKIKIQVYTESWGIYTVILTDITKVKLKKINK